MTQHAYRRNPPRWAQIVAALLLLTWPALLIIAEVR